MVISNSTGLGEDGALVLDVHIRISGAALKELIRNSLGGAAGLPSRQQTPRVDEGKEQQKEHGLQVPAGLSWIQELVAGAPFTHGWPQRRADYGKDDNLDPYAEAWVGEIVLHGQRISVKVGIGSRYGRGRMTVFFDDGPVCEFAEIRDGGEWASIVKPNGKKVLFPGQEIPALYESSRLELYREVTGFKGPGVPGGLALVIGSRDFRSAVHHAAARWLGKRNLPLTIAS